MGCESSKRAKTVSSLNEVIIVFSSSDRPTLHVHAWHLRHKKWYDLSKNFPKAREHFAAIAAGSKIVVTGGSCMDTVLSETLIYNSLTNNWKKGPNLNTARRRHGSVEVEGKVFVLGGDNSRSLLDSVEMFDRGRWETAGNLAEVVADPVAISSGNRILLIGGNKESSFFENNLSCLEIHCFDVETKSASIFQDFSIGNVLSGTLVSEVLYLITDNSYVELQLISVKEEDDDLELPKHRVFTLPMDIQSVTRKHQFVVADGVGFIFTKSSTRQISLDAEETDKVVLPTIPGSVSDVWADFTMLVGDRSLH